MGLAASQARLLTITARLTDNELRSQTINNAKMRLATQSSQASENYINALNNATYQFTNYDLTGGLVSQPLTFNALTAYSPYNTQYGLVNAAGQLLVSENEAKLFIAANGNLDDYLKSHHLVYDTSYFEKIAGSTNPNDIAFQNINYPEPFDKITIEELQEYYEGYNGYENSVEVEKYNRAYSAFNRKAKDLQKAGAYVMEQYLLHGAEDIIEKESGAFIFKDTEGDVLSKIKNAFLNSAHNFNLNTLHNKGFLSDDYYQDLVGTLNYYQETTEGLQVTEDCSIESETSEATPTMVNYSINGGDLVLTVDSNTGFVYSYNDAGLRNSFSGDNTVYTSHFPELNRFSIVNFLNSSSYDIQETDADGNVTKSSSKYHATKDADGNYHVTSTVSIANESKAEVLNELVDYIMNSIIFSTDYEKFADFLTDTDATELNNQYGIDINQPIPSSDNLTMEDILEAYRAAKDEFFKNIFDEDSIPKVLSDLENHTETDIYDEFGTKLDPVEVNIDNLQDIDFLLQYIAHNEDIKQSENFNTVIKEYLIDNMIDQYGTPKYAWIDENDKTSNQENADAKAQWYTNLFKRMQKGYKALENGLASSKEWIEYALESGTVYMEQVDGSFAWNALDYKTCSRIIEETDDRAVAKAEAEYNRAMNDIKAKDSIYDLELKNIDTEHNALQTEYDVIKGVINKNIERNFKFNQSA